MSTDDITPTTDSDAPLREVTVSVPEHRVEQFHRFHARFLEMAAHWDAQVGNEDLHGRRGRRRCGRRGAHHRGRCAHHTEATATTGEPTA